MENTEQQIRLECLKAVTAAVSNGVSIADEAEKLYAFITTGKESATSINEPHVEAYAELCRRAKAARGEWQPDWSNGDQKKWYPWFEYTPSGFVVTVTIYYYHFTNASVGSRLCFPTREMAKAFAEENLELYRIILSN